MNPNKSKFRRFFFCTGSSARSIMAEFVMRKIAAQKFDVESAGSDPKPAPHPLALAVLRDQYKLDISSARSKWWREFDGAEFDFVITLCDDARETCPVWQGQPILAHWSSPDPAEVEGPDEVKARVFWQVAQQIQRRIDLLASLPFDKLEAATKEIGQCERITLSQPTNP